jgi:hypothetical protein
LHPIFSSLLSSLTLTLSVFLKARVQHGDSFGGDVPTGVTKTFWLNKFHDNIKLHDSYSNCAGAYSLWRMCQLEPRNSSRSVYTTAIKAKGADNERGNSTDRIGMCPAEGRKRA